MPGPDAAEGQFPDSIEGQGAGSNLAPAVGPSIGYRKYDDLTTNSSVVLNDAPELAFEMFWEQNAEGIQWNLSYKPDSAVIYAVSLTTSPVPAKVGPIDATAATGESSAGMVQFDFPTTPAFNPGSYAFYAETKVNGRTDVSSGVIVTVKPPLASLA